MTIAEYLVELRRHLRVGPFAKRRILREIEAHLIDSAARTGSEGDAVASFGSPELVAARLSAPPLRLGASLGVVAVLGTGLVALLSGISGTTGISGMTWAARLGRCTIIELKSVQGRGRSVVVLPETPDGTSTSTVTFSGSAAAGGPVSLRLASTTVRVTRSSRCDP